MAVVASTPGFTFGTMPWFAVGSTKRTPAKETMMARCWQSFDAEDSKAKSIMKEEVRKHGVPPSVRADAYFALSGAPTLQREQPQGTYSTLAASTSGLGDEIFYNVEDDVRNVRATFKDTRLFSTAKGAEVLSRVIFAYIQYNPACGYFKGLAHIAALLLTVFGREREEQAFWTVAALLKRRLFPLCDGQVALGSRVEAHVLQQLLEQRQPALATVLAKLRPDAVEQLCTSWFSTAFTRNLPHEVVLRIWDCLVVEGPKVAQRVAMALVKTVASSIQSCSNMETLCRVVDGRLARTPDADSLLSVAFKGVGSLSSATVDAARSRALAHVQSQQRTPTAPLAAAALGGRQVSSALSTSSRGSSGSANGGASWSGSGGAGGGGGSHSGGGQASSRPSSKHAVQWASPKSTGALLSVA